MFQRIIEPCSLVSAVFEVPTIVVCVPWSFSLIVIRERIQGSPILTPLSSDNTYDVSVGADDNPGVASWDTPSLTVSDDTGDKVNPTVEIES